MVALPLLVLAVYLYTISAVRFTSVTGMSVRAEETLPEGGLIDGLSAFSGGTKPDAAILRDFLTSVDLVQRLDQRIGLKSRLIPPEFDPVYAQNPENLERLHQRWQQLVTVTLDGRSGLVTLRVSGFTPEDARALSLAAIRESDAMLARLSDNARENATRLAMTELTLAEDRLRDAREKLTAFRASAQIVDPLADIEGQLGVMASLQGQMAEAQIALGLLRQSASETDTRLIQAERRVAIVSDLLAQERRKFGLGEDGYAGLTATYEGLRLEVEYASERYVIARASLDAEMAAAQKTGRYLAVHVAPVAAETATLPRKGQVLGLTGFALILIWATGLFTAAGLKRQN